jgi:PncC family amidohydrolase
MLSDSLTGAAAEVAERLVARGEGVAVAEITAGGLISAALLSVPGASAYFRGGYVVYTGQGIETALAGSTDLDRGSRGASEPLARYLAAGARANYGAEWGIGETGASGPDGNPYGDDPGFTWVAVAGPGGVATAERVETGSADRPRNMEAFALGALRALGAALG